MSEYVVMSERRSFGGQPRGDVCCSITKGQYNGVDRIGGSSSCESKANASFVGGQVGENESVSSGAYKRTRRGCRGRGGKPRSNVVSVTLESLQLNERAVDLGQGDHGACAALLMDERELLELDVEVGDVGSDPSLESSEIVDLGLGSSVLVGSVSNTSVSLDATDSSLISRAVVFNEKQHGYSYVDLLDPSRVSEAVRILGNGPTLRRLLRLGPAWFKPVAELNQMYIEVGSYCGTVVPCPLIDGAYARFWAIVRTVPEMELQAGWKELMKQSRSVRCHVPCVAHPGYVMY